MRLIRKNSALTPLQRLNEIKNFIINLKKWGVFPLEINEVRYDLEEEPLTLK